MNKFKKQMSRERETVEIACAAIVCACVACLIAMGGVAIVLW